MTLATVTLNDKYALETGRVYLSGIQALVRLPLVQKKRDLAAGLNTGGFISGYRGSPLGGYDQALTNAKKFLTENNIHFQPGVNEDLAATSVWGSQQIALTPGANVDGVFGIWYGKGPGVDRTVDVFKHANAAGVAPNGGVLALMGDDHGCQSSTLAHQSEQVMAAAMIPIVNPATIQEYIDFGLYGFELSRYSGCWVGFKAVTETVESSASISVDPGRLKICIPTDFEMPPGGLGIRWPDPPLDQEARLHGPKMLAVAAFARANPIDRQVWATPGARVGIITTGKAHLDTLQALEDLGIDERRARAMGISLYKVGLTWPLETQGLLRFAEGLEEIIVIEEKRGFVEDQVIKALYNLPRRPIVVGKTAEDGRVILPSQGELDPMRVAQVIGDRLINRLGENSELRQRMAWLNDKMGVLSAPTATLARTPFFCSGCPHNTSTRVPEGSRAMGGIGCHGMVLAIPERRTSLITHMGGEGATWIGQAPFKDENHVFQNLGDGTYYHSGLLAIRAAAAAKVNITYKILFNDAVAMTGGQPHDGPLTVPQVTQQIAAEGAKRVVVVSDEPEKYGADAGFAPGVTVRHRDDLDAIQRELRDVPGLTAIVYDQTCAAEKRRRRKRGLYPDPPKRIFINDRVCEGCGDCSAKSNCVAVKPVDTDYGRKRRIDQSDCNKDFSCVKGFCPSFVTVHGGALRKQEKKSASTATLDNVPTPTLPALDDTYNILITGIGGTGVITIGALLGMAAHLEGKGCSILDFTGLAQKNGSVQSHVRLSRDPNAEHATRIGVGDADLVVACDAVVAAGITAISRMETGKTRAVINSNVQPTAQFVRNTDFDFRDASIRRSLDSALRAGAAYVDATGLATAIMGDSIATNLFMVGFAWQRGLVPLQLGSINRAIELNAVAIDANKQAFAWGRLAAHDLPAVEAAARPTMPAPQVADTDSRSLAERRRADLVIYQDEAYAARYASLVSAAEAAEQPLGERHTGFALGVAREFYRLMAYKDEYEVGRLYTDGDFKKKLDAQFQGDFKLSFHLAPPTLSLFGSTRTEPKKVEFGRWMMMGFGVLAKLRGIRGSWADPFGHTKERRMERQLIDDYEKLMRETIAALSAANYTAAVALAEWPEMIRGYGHIKDKNAADARARLPALLQAFRAPAAANAAA